MFDPNASAKQAPGDIKGDPLRDNHLDLFAAREDVREYR
jgi:hypothetical protein